MNSDTSLNSPARAALFRRANPHPIYLTGHETGLDAESRHFILRRPGERPVRIPSLRVERIVAQGGTLVTQAALKLALESKTPVTFLDGAGQILGHLSPARSHRVDLRLAQYALHQDAATRLQAATRLVARKLQVTEERLRRHVKNHADPVVRQAAQAVADLRARAEAGVPSLEALRGVEGAGARAYYQVFGRLLSGPFTFDGRHRQPPRDPVNALLSYGYCVLTRDMAARLELTGADPYLGFLHEIKHDTAALALDLIEPLRLTVIDRLVLRLINRKMIQPEHFDRFRRQPVLTRDGRRIFFTAYAATVHPAAVNHPDVVTDAGNRVSQVCRNFCQDLLAGRLASWEPEPPEVEAPDPAGDW